jgi:hypothetical protein
VQILKELTGPGSGSSAASQTSDEGDAEPLRKLAAELALVAAAAQAGPRAYVLGRSRGMWASVSDTCCINRTRHCYSYADKACEPSICSSADDCCRY